MGSEARPAAAELLFSAQDLGAIAAVSVGHWRTCGGLLWEASRASRVGAVAIVGESGSVSRFHPSEPPDLSERPLDDVAGGAAATAYAAYVRR